MNNNNMTVREIDLVDMLYCVCKKWRQIICNAIIIALLIGLGRFGLGVIQTIDPEKTAEAEERYQIVLADYEARGESLKTRISNLRDSSANQEEYNEKSILMKIDYMNRWNGNIRIYIDSMYKIDPTLTYQTPDLTGRLLSAYSSYLTSGEFYNEIFSKSDIVDEIRFLTEIYGVSVDSGSSTITVSVTGASEEDVRELLGYAKEKIESVKPIINQTVGDHNCDILNESVYSVIDLDLDATQKANIQAVTDYATAIGETNEQLEEWEKEPAPKREYGWSYTFKKSVKITIIGGFVGAIAIAFFGVVQYVCDGKLKTEADWKAFGIPVFGAVHRDRQEKKLHCIDLLIDRLFNREVLLSYDDQCKIIANNLCLVAKENNCYELTFVGKGNAAKSLVEKLSEAETDIKFSYAGHILTDADSARRLADIDELLFVAGKDQVSFKELRSVLTVLQAGGKSILGAIIVD